MHTLIRLLEREFEGERKRVLERGERGDCSLAWAGGEHGSGEREGQVELLPKWREWLAHMCGPRFREKGPF